VFLLIRLLGSPSLTVFASRTCSTNTWIWQRVVCGSPAYLGARGVPRTPADVGEHDCITFDAVSAADQWTFRVDKGESMVPVRSRRVVNTAEAAVDAAPDGPRPDAVGVVPDRRGTPWRGTERGAGAPRAGADPVSLDFNARQRIPLNCVPCSTSRRRVCATAARVGCEHPKPNGD
jgi:hypothetical protein